MFWTLMIKKFQKITKIITKKMINVLIASYNYIFTDVKNYYINTLFLQSKYQTA